MDMTKSIHAVALAVFSMFALAGTGQATSFTFTATGGCSVACSGTAVITPGAGTLTAVLTSTQENPQSSASPLSGIEIIPLGGPGTTTGLVQTGQLITLTSTVGPYTTSPGPPTHWAVGVGSGHIVLETAGSFAPPLTPINMIIGPPDGSGNYSNANTSITDGNFSPYINGTGTFVISDPAITAATPITGVNFCFGNGPDTCLPGVTVSTTPEPNSLVLLGFGFITTAGFHQWRKRKPSKSEVLKRSESQMVTMTNPYKRLFLFLVAFASIATLSTMEAQASNINILFQDSTDPPTIIVTGTDPEITVINQGCQGEACMVVIHNDGRGGLNKVVESSLPNILVEESASSGVTSDQMFAADGAFIGSVLLSFVSYNTNSPESCFHNPPGCTQIIETGNIQNAGTIMWEDGSNLTVQFQSDLDVSNPVPEPSSIFLLGIGLGLGPFLGRRLALEERPKSFSDSASDYR